MNESRDSKKSVSFASSPKIYILSKWNYAYRQARIGNWEEAARDRDRFKRRIIMCEKVLEPIFNINNRDQMYKRFCTKDL